MTNGERVLAIATKEIGYQQGKNQDNKYGRWFGMNNCAWCVIFSAAWCYNQAGLIGDMVGRTYKEGGLYSASQTLNWYREHDPDCIKKEGVPGCLVIFDFPKTKAKTDHMGLFVKLEGGKITSIDGNTSGTNNSNGGWVRQRSRRLQDLDNVWYIVPRELTEAPKDDDGEEDDAEVRYNTMKEISDGAPWATETVQKLIDDDIIKGGGLRDTQGRPADMNLSLDMLRLLVMNDRAGLYD